MDNNQPQNMTGIPNQNPNVGSVGPTPVEPPMSQPMGQPIPQPVPQPMPMGQPILNQPMDGGAANNKSSTKIIIFSIVAAVVVAAVVVLLVFLLGTNERTVTCESTDTELGMKLKNEVSIKVKNKKIDSGTITISADLRSLEKIYKEREEQIIDAVTEEYKSECKDEHCKFDYNYDKGNSVKYVLQYDAEGVEESMVHTYGGVDNMSTQEIADKLQKTLEDSKTTCKQH